MIQKFFYVCGNCNVIAHTTKSEYKGLVNLNVTLQFQGSKYIGALLEHKCFTCGENQSLFLNINNPDNMTPNTAYEMMKQRKKIFKKINA